MQKRSAGLLMFREREGELQVFLIHPGGPFWKNKDLGAWSIPKGEYLDDEVPLDAARREFNEETGFTAHGPFFSLGDVRQKSGKIVSAWACEGDCNPAELKSNLCEIEWPPRSGKKLEVCEADKGEWFTIAEGHERLLAAQRPFLERLQGLRQSERTGT